MTRIRSRSRSAGVNELIRVISGSRNAGLDDGRVRDHSPMIGESSPAVAPFASAAAWKNRPCIA